MPARSSPGSLASRVAPGSLLWPLSLGTQAAAKWVIQGCELPMRWKGGRGRRERWGERGRGKRSRSQPDNWLQYLETMLAMATKSTQHPARTGRSGCAPRRVGRRQADGGQQWELTRAPTKGHCSGVCFTVGEGPSRDHRVSRDDLKGLCPNNHWGWRWPPIPRLAAQAGDHYTVCTCILIR